MTAASLFSEPMVQRLGWTLVHSLWQGTVIAAALAGVLRLLRAAPANVRYATACTAMSLMVFAAVFTFTRIQVASAPAVEAQPPHPIAAAKPQALTVSPAMPMEMPATAPTPQNRRPAVLRIVVLVWAAGVTLLSLWHVGGWFWLRRLRRGNRVEHWQTILERLAKTLNIRRAVALIETMRIDVPAVAGVLRPVILVPAGVLSGLTPQQVEAILAHELAHVRRHDYLVNLIQAAVETLMFYHPATWWISSQIRQERENCCDDIAAKICGDGGVYASALAALEERRGPAPARIALAATGGNLLARVRRVLKLPPIRRPSRIRSLAAAIVAVSCVALPILVAAEQQQQQTKTEPPAKMAGAAANPEQPSSPITSDDLKETIEDYRTGPGDLVSVSITDLVAPGVETVKQMRVSETGIITMPLVQPIKVTGLTVPQIETAVQKAYRDANLMPMAQVSVTVAEPKQRLFNILGQVDKPGQYAIVKPGFRLMDALAQAGARSGDLTTLRVIRNENGKQRVIEIPIEKLVAGDAGVNVVLRPGDTIIAAVAPKHFVKIVIGKETLFHDGKPIDMAGVRKLFEAMPETERRGTVLEIAAAAKDVTVDRYFSVSAQLSDLVKKYKLAYLSETGIQPTTEPAARAELQPGTIGVGQAPSAVDDAQIRAHMLQLEASLQVYRQRYGPKHPIVLNTQASIDNLSKQYDIGEYYVTGVKRPGVYSLAGRTITLKQALAAAGGPEAENNLAKITVIRREGDKESVVMKDIPVADLIDGRTKDAYLRANDIVQVKPQDKATLDRLNKLVNERTLLAEQLNVLLGKFGPDHAEVRATAQQLSRVDIQIAAESGTTKTSPPREP